MLHVKKTGQGEPLVLLHGWGMHGGLMADLAESLAQEFEVFQVDLPGHGMSSPLEGGGFDVNVVLDVLSSSLPHEAHWVGWSLGGLLSLSMALRAPDRVRSLVMIASSPRFVEASGWTGIPLALLEQMGRDFVTDYGQTLTRFVGLQTFGQEKGRHLAKLILTQLARAPEPDAQSLLNALELLKTLDLRDSLSRLGQPLTLILGGRDRLVPVGQVEQLKVLLPALDIRLIESAAHLPFMTHREEVASILGEVLSMHPRCM